MRHSDTSDQDEDWRKNALNPFDSHILSSIKGVPNVGVCIFSNRLKY